MLFFDRLQDIYNRITMPEPYGLRFSSNDKEDKHFLQILCKDTCNVTGKPLIWKSRKWQLSPHMTDGEIVQTALKACLTAAEHEIREKFKYRGVSIFDPHYDIEKLVELRRQSDSIKEREHA